MMSKALFSLLLACAATAVLSAEAGSPLQKRADGLISNMMSYGGSLTKTAVDKLVNGGHASMDAINSMINYGADTMKSAANTILRRDLGYDGISNAIGQAQADLDASWRAANQLASNLRPTLSDRGQEVLDLYMKELRDSRNAYGPALRNAAANARDLLNRMDTSSLSADADLWSLIQDGYSANMVDYAAQVRRLGNVLNNNGFNI